MIHIVTKRTRKSTIVNLNIFIILIVFFTSILYSKNNEADNLFYKGIEVKDNNLKIEYFTKAISIAPADAKIYYTRGNAYYNLNLFNKAIKDYSKAISLEPSNTDFYNNRGNAFSKFGRYNESIKDYSKSISINSNDAVTYFNRANALAQLKHYEDAIKDYSKALLINTKDTNSYYQRGLSFYFLNRFDDAIKDFTHALSIDSSNADFYYARGVAYSKIKVFNEAIKNISKYFSLNPDSTSQYYAESKRIYNQLKDLKGNQTEGWLVNGKLTTQTYNLKFEKGFGAQLWQTDDSSFMRLWNTPSDTFKLPIISSVKRGTPLYTVIFFGNAGFKNDRCNVVADMVIYDPRGKIYGERRNLNVWNDLPPLSNREIGLSVEYMAIIIEPKDPSGTYNVTAVVTDKLKNVKINLETKFTVK
jgi:tetratricopeptide (TPR) repeat protein